MVEKILNCAQRIIIIIPITIITLKIIFVINMENFMRDREKAYKTYKIFFILTFVEILVSITVVVFKLILKDLTLICPDIFFSVFYGWHGWLYFKEYKILKKLKKGIHQCDEDFDRRKN